MTNNVRHSHLCNFYRNILLNGRFEPLIVKIEETNDIFALFPVELNEIDLKCFKKREDLTEAPFSIINIMTYLDLLGLIWVTINKIKVLATISHCEEKTRKKEKNSIEDLVYDNRELLTIFKLGKSEP